MSFEMLLSPVKIGSLTIRNRVIMGAMGNDTCDENQMAGPQACEYYAARAKGGVGLIVNETTRVADTEDAVMGIHQTSAASDRVIPSLKAIADSVHKYDGAIFMQLHHPGRQCYDANRTGLTPSGVKSPCIGAPCRAMTIDEIHDLREKFIQAAVRCKKAGIDGVELHAAHGYLLNQFLSPHTNFRNDEYGGNTENRCRFIAEIITGIREQCGDYPIMLRISADEFLETSALPLEGKGEGIKIEEAIKICKYLIPFGVDAIDVSAGVYETQNKAWEPSNYEEGWKIYLAEEIKKVVSVPVSCAGTIRTPEIAEAALESGRLDMVTITRGLLADPEWVNKVKEGRTNEIRKCISCLNCMETIGRQQGLLCSINACATHEFQYPEIKKDGNGRKVVVVGAGPGGLESARVLSERGFAVTLFEKENQLGGQLQLANKAPGKDKINWFIEYEKTMLEKNGVDIRLNTCATVESIDEIDPYAIFVSTGSMPVIPGRIPGCDGENVCTAPDILSGKERIENSDVLILGSGMTGMETAEYLLEYNNHIAIADMLPEIAQSCYFQNTKEIFEKLNETGTDYYPGHKLLRVEADGAILETADEKEIKVKADKVILSLGVRADVTLAETLETKYSRVFRIGETRKTGKIYMAVATAFSEAYKLA